MTSSEETKIVQELKREWAQLQKRAFAVLVAALIIACGYGVWVGTIQTRIDNGEAKQAELTASVAAIEARQHANDISSAEIKTQLANIERIILGLAIDVKNLTKQ